MAQRTISPDLDKLIGELVQQDQYITDERKAKLEALTDGIVHRLDKGSEAQVVFICMHNSRRSPISELWLQTLAAHYGLEGIEAFSGGTEGAAFNPRMVSAAARAGFELEKLDDSDNPRYLVNIAGKRHLLFSKEYEDETNPQSGFIAVMVCSEAEAACPLVHGADLRISLPFKDPKAFDGTDVENQMYDELLLAVGRELAYAMKLTQEKLSAK